MNLLNPVVQQVAELLKGAADFLQQPPEPGAAPPATEPTPETKPQVPAKAESDKRHDALIENDQSVENMRATAKWIITLLSAIAAAVLAGTQLTSFGKLAAPDWLEDARLGLALLSGAVALACTGYIIAQATKVLTVGGAQISDLVTNESKQPPDIDVEYVKKIGVLVGEYGNQHQQTIADFQRQRTTLQKAYEQAKDALLEAKIALVADPESKELLAAVAVAKLKLESAAAKRSSHAFRRGLLLSALRAEIVGRTMAGVARPMVIAAVISGMALGVFVWSINPPEEDDSLPFEVPAHGYVRLSDDNQKQWRNELGDNCVKGPIYVMVLDVTEDEAEVVSVVGNGCSAARFTVSLDELYPGMRVIVPAQETTPNPKPTR